MSRMNEAPLIHCPGAQALPSGVRILLAPADYPPLAIDTPLLDLATPASRRQRERLADMLRDLDRLRGGWVPSNHELGAAPRLTHWRSVAIFGSRLPALYGLCEGHPVLGSRAIMTSPVAAFDSERYEWARTVSRFYRLSRPSARTSR
jgi:hypothetical protein